MTKEALQVLINTLDAAYSSLSDEERLLAAYQLRYAVNSYLLHYHYGHIVFDDDNIDIDSIKFCIDRLSGKRDERNEWDTDKRFHTANLPVIELLICLSHMKLKDRLKIIYVNLASERCSGYFTGEAAKEYYPELEDELEEMHYSHNELVRERKEELQKFRFEEHISIDVASFFHIYEQ